MPPHLLPLPLVHLSLIGWFPLCGQEQPTSASTKTSSALPTPHKKIAWPPHPHSRARGGGDKTTVPHGRCGRGRGDGMTTPQASAALAPSFSVHCAYKSRQSLPFRSLSLSPSLPMRTGRWHKWTSTMAATRHDDRGPCSHPHPPRVTYGATAGPQRGGGGGGDGVT